MILTEGARVRLRMMRREDADELYALLSDEAVMRWLEPPFNRAQAERFLEQAGLSDPPLIYAAESAEGEFLGYAIYHDYDDHSRELGWVLKPAFWHKGYADEMTDSMKRAIGETERRRGIQAEYNRVHNIVPRTIKSEFKNTLEITKKRVDNAKLSPQDLVKEVERLKGLMKTASAALDFERAIKLRDEMNELKKQIKKLK